MKPILLIFICVACSWGQGSHTLLFEPKTHYYLSVDSSDYYEITENIGASFYYYEKRKDGTLDFIRRIDTKLVEETTITLQDLLDYEKECEKDIIFWDETSEYGRTRTRIHKEPTFKGFIEFLKRRKK